MNSYFQWHGQLTFLFVIEEPAWTSWFLCSFLFHVFRKLCLWAELANIMSKVTCHLRMPWSLILSWTETNFYSDTSPELDIVSSCFADVRCVLRPLACWRKGKQLMPYLSLELITTECSHNVKKRRTKCLSFHLSWQLDIGKEFSLFSLERIWDCWYNTIFL